MVNAAFYPGTETLQPKVNFTTLQADVNSTTAGFGGGSGFNVDFIFGDYGKAITVFMNMISGGYIVQTMELLAFPDYFTIPFQAIIGVMTLGAV